MENTHLTEEELVERYEQVLDLNTVSLGFMDLSFTFQPSRVIRTLDPVGYRTGLANYADYLQKSEGTTAEGYVS
jgi:hypothetical protein